MRWTLLMSVFLLHISKIRGGDLAQALNGIESGLGTSYQTAYAQCIASNECKGTVDTVQADIGKVADSFEASSILVVSLTSTQSAGWGGVAKKLSEVGPFLAVAGPLVSIAASFTSSTEQQLLEEVLETINKGFEKMEERFDSIEVGLRSVENEIKQQSFWTQLTEPINNMNAINRKIEMYLTTTDFAAREERRRGLNNDDYNLLFRSMSAIDDKFRGEFTDDLCKTVREFTKVDLKKVIAISADLYERLLRASQNYLFIAASLGKADLQQSTEYWEGQLREISGLIGKCEADIKNNYFKSQWKSDVEEAAAPFVAAKEKETAKAIYDKLSQKYYFHDWIVLVYGDTSGSKNHFWQSCGVADGNTVELPHYHSKYNIFVSWVPKSRTKANSEARRSEILQIPVWDMKPVWEPTLGNTMLPTDFEASDIFNRMPSWARTCTCMLRGVVRQKRVGDFKAYTAHGRQLAVRKHGYDVYVWIYCLG